LYNVRNQIFENANICVTDLLFQTFDVVEFVLERRNLRDIWYSSCLLGGSTVWKWAILPTFLRKFLLPLSKWWRF